MTVTVLQMMNASLKRVGVIQGDQGSLATSTVTSTATGLTATEAFTVSAHQRQIDVMLQLWNEAFHELEGIGLVPDTAATATMTLVTAQREYAVPADFEQMAGDDYLARVLRGATTGLRVYEYPDGYARMLADQPVATDWTGDPGYWAINPSAVAIRLDREPTSGQSGNTYNYLYQKRLSFTSTMATSPLPYSDTVIDSLVPVVSEAHTRVFKKEFDAGMFRASLTRAVGFVTRTRRRNSYGRG